MCIEYSITDDDFYSFDVTRFMMRVISFSMIVTRSDRHGRSEEFNQLPKKALAKGIELLTSELTSV